jgi:hypothetical protein
MDHNISTWIKMKEEENFGEDFSSKNVGSINDFKSNAIYGFMSCGFTQIINSTLVRSEDEKIEGLPYKLKKNIIVFYPKSCIVESEDSSETFNYDSIDNVYLGNIIELIYDKPNKINKENYEGFEQWLVSMYLSDLMNTKRDKFEIKVDIIDIFRSFTLSGNDIPLNQTYDELMNFLDSNEIPFNYVVVNPEIVDGKLDNNSLEIIKTNIELVEL